MKKICFIHSYGAEAFRGESVGGTELQLYNISTALAGDYDVTFLTRAEGTVEGVKLLPGLGSVGSWSEKIRSGLRLLRYMRKVDADVYFSSADTMIPGLVSVYCRLTGKKHIQRTVHQRELDLTLFEKSLSRGLGNNIGLRLADTVLVQSREHGRMLSSWTDSRWRVLKNSFPLGDRTSTGGDYVLWVGRRVEWKRPGLALDLAEKFPDHEFVMISPRTGGTEALFDRVEQRANEIDNLELIERVPRDEIQDYFDGAKLFLNTSEKEGFPNTFVEAGIGSTPILSYTVDPDGFIEAYDCGYSCNGDEELLANRLEQMLEEGGLDEKGENTRRYVEENHDIEKNIEIVKEEIERLAGGSR